MDRFKAQAFVKEFPWLIDFYSQRTNSDPAEFVTKQFTEIKVKRLDENTLSKVHYYREGCAECYSAGSKLHIIANCGVYEVLSETDNKGNYGWETSKGETALELIDRIGLHKKVIAIVEEKYDGDDGSKKLLIWKLPKNISIIELVEIAQKEAEQQVAAEVNF